MTRVDEILEGHSSHCRLVFWSTVRPKKIALFMTGFAKRTHMKLRTMAVLIIAIPAVQLAHAVIPYEASIVCPRNKNSTERHNFYAKNDAEAQSEMLSVLKSNSYSGKGCQVTEITRRFGSNAANPKRSIDYELSIVCAKNGNSTERTSISASSDLEAQNEANRILRTDQYARKGCAIRDLSRR